jgi:hypothetical protein
MGKAKRGRCKKGAQALIMAFFLLVAIVPAQDYPILSTDQPVPTKPEIILPELARANLWLEDALWRAGILAFLENDSMNLTSGDAYV